MIVSVESTVKQAADVIARIVEQWREQRPDLDPSPMLVVGRIQRLAATMDTALRPTFARAELAPGDFDVLAALRRAGPPHAHTAGELREALRVTGGAVSKQVDRLVGKGLVTRAAGVQDARVRRVGLTAEGVALVDELIAVHLDVERGLLSRLTDDQTTALASALALLSRQLEAEGGRRNADRE